MPHREVRRALALAAPFLLLALLTKLPSLGFKHREPDEVIYWTVAQHLGEYGNYSLRGAPFMHKLPRQMYDRPLFHHPPLYPALLVPFAKRELRSEAIVISWFGHCLAIVAVALIGVRLHARFGQGTPRLAALALPLLGITLDPVLVHVARKLWIDALAGGLAALAVALTLVALARERRRPAWLVAAGIVLGLAGLAKLPGLLVAPVCALLVLAHSAPWRTRSAYLACVAAPALLVVAPWFWVFFANYGTLLPNFAAPSAELAARFPMVAASIAKPWHFYATKLAVVQPLLVVGVAGFAWKRPRGERRSPESWALFAWLALLIACWTYLGATSFSFQMRYLTPLTPALYLLPLALPAWYRAPSAFRLRSAAALAIAWATLGAAPYLINGRPDEFVGFAEAIGLVRF